MTEASPQTLAPAVLRLWQLGGVATAAATTAIAAIVAGALGGGSAWSLPLVTAVVGGGLAAVVPRARYDRWRWRLTPLALEIEHGVVWRQVRALPYFRIQHIDVEHGPLDRWLGLARLEVHTASVTATIPGLDADLAPQLRARLLGLVEETVEQQGTEDGRDAV